MYHVGIGQMPSSGAEIPELRRAWITGSKKTAFLSLENRLSEVSQRQTQPFMIYRVHKHLRNINNRAYGPEIIAIGPYHYDELYLKMMNERKLRYLQLLLQRREQNVGIYTSAIREIEQEVRNCYAEPVILNSDKFIEMLVLDGCFIIDLIRKYKSRDSTCKEDPIFQTGWIMNSLQRDLMLFENQIPFFVLCKLFDLIEPPGNRERLINLILHFFQDLYPGAGHRNCKDWSLYKPKHLLDLIHSNWLPPSPDVHSNWLPPPRDDIHVKIDIPLLPPKKRLETNQTIPKKRGFQSIQSATELTGASVRFRKQECHSLFEVKFKDGILRIPPLTIEDRTECFFRNLIAYEQYLPSNRPTFVTDYAVLLNCLIDSSRDVEILSQHGIINNWLGDDEVVARIFNQITDLVTCANRFYYAETFSHINAHYKKGWNRARAVLHRVYLDSPWAYISLFGAFLLILLTVAQTVFSALQAT